MVEITEDYSVTLPNIRIPITFQFIQDTTDGSKKIKNKIHMAIIQGIRDCIKYMIQEKAEVIIPESLFRDPPYSPKYYAEHSEELKQTFIDFMDAEIRRHFTSSRELQEEYHVKQKWEASYAEVVNEMVGVNWSKAGSHGGFIEEIDKFLREHLCRFIDKRLNKIDPTLTLMYQVI